MTPQTAEGEGGKQHKHSTNEVDDTEIEIPASAYDEYAGETAAGGDKTEEDITTNEDDSPSPKEMSIQHKIENLPGILMDEDEEVAEEENDEKEDKSKAIEMPSATGASTPPTQPVMQGNSSSHLMRNIIIVLLILIAGLYVWGRQIVVQEQQNEAVEAQVLYDQEGPRTASEVVQ